MINNTRSEISKPGSQKRIVVRWLVRETMGVIMVAAILFISAGQIGWGWGWAMVAAVALWVAGMYLAIVPSHPDLLAERLRPKQGTKSWDTAIMGLVGLVELARYLLAGLDQRYGWTGGIGWLLQGAGLLVTLAGYAIVVWASRTNAFFSLNVRLQTERGQQVVSSGPYRLVRHPAYIGSILYLFASAILLGSSWALIPGAIGSILMIVRTALEDRTLQKELAGYADYTSRVRYRLLPGVW